MGYNKDKDYSYTGVADPSVIREDIIHPATIEDVDIVVNDYVKSLNIHTNTNKGLKPVEVIWVSAERSFQVKNNPDLRDSNDVFILPSITLERTNITKDLTRKGGVFGNIAKPGDGRFGKIEVARRIVQDKTQDNANADAKRRYGQSTYKFQNKKVVYETVTIPMPVYINVEYTVTLRTEYLQQMNDLMTPFLNTGMGINYIPLHRNGHAYELFLQDSFSAENNVSSMGQEERKYESKVNFRVLGYILGNGVNDERPKVETRQNFVSVKIGRERVILSDTPEIVTDSELTNYRD
tara:strand:+ start:150 stop:1031 length:882 start_codon:yes stop_codon:yes gene_type:complete